MCHRKTHTYLASRAVNVESRSLSEKAPLAAPAPPPPSYDVVIGEIKGDLASPLEPTNVTSAPISLGPLQDTPVCAAGHDGRRVFGIAGIVGAILFFPWGLFWTACDSSIACRRCGVVVKPSGCARKRARRDARRAAAAGKV
ncbi:hypothetical protein Q5752_005051 [Cryptotrichosporon argae]